MGLLVEQGLGMIPDYTPHRNSIKWASSSLRLDIENLDGNRCQPSLVTEADIEPRPESGTDYIEVSRLDRSGTSISIGGDILGAGAINQGEGVIVQRVGFAEVPETLGYCTHCGKALDAA